jgi:hypothetical protein
MVLLGIVIASFIILISWMVRTSAIPYFLDYGHLPWQMHHLKASEVEFLKKYFRYYHLLPPRSQQIFERRVAVFMHSKSFIPRQMEAVSKEMQVLISASAIQLTFGFPRVHLSFFQYILVFPDQYYSRHTQRYHKGEVNPKAKSIVLAWRHFVEGYMRPDGRNLGLHEMAHALRLENRIMNKEYNFMDPHWLREWEIHADNTIREIRDGRETFFRAYGAQDREEFFAVAVENFFERPLEFYEKHPLTYDTLAALLKQDPRRFIEEKMHSGKI